MKNKLFALLTITLILGLTGCATNRGIVHLDIPSPERHAASNGKAVYIEKVTDARIFQAKPKTQDIPSLGFGGAEAADETIRKRAIARKRNSYGQALGDILLEEGQTVETIIHDSLEQAFAKAGYKVIQHEEDITKKTTRVSAKIMKFWAYMTPGFWAITLSSDIATDIELTSPDNKIEQISVHSDGKYQFAGEEQWLEIIHTSIGKYIDAVNKKIK